MPKDEGFDPEGDGPTFRRDISPSDLSFPENVEFARKMERTRRARAAKDPTKPKKRRAPSKKKIERGIERQRIMNETQFREPLEMKSLPNPNYKYEPPPPGSYGGPPL